MLITCSVTYSIQVHEFIDVVFGGIGSLALDLEFDDLLGEAGGQDLVLRVVFFSDGGVPAVLELEGVRPLLDLAE